jgi:arginine decarboxylase
MASNAVQKMTNRVKAKLEERRSPVEKDQETVPIADAMKAYWDRDMLSFAIPAHNGGRGPAPEFTSWAGMDCARYDLPMSHGVDTRDRAWGVQSTAQELFAEAVGSKQTLFSTNGSSMNVRVAIMSVAGPGETLVMARNGHKSSFAGLVLSGARPVYVDPVYDEDLELAHTVTPDALAAALDEHPEAQAALVFTPSYYGTAADVRGLAEICHARDIPLVTDDAWGLDYAFSGHPALPEGALAQGSDLAIGSAHKTLTSLGQTSVLSVGSDRIDVERLQLCFELEESTSASTLLLSSIDGARRQAMRKGTELLDRAVRAAELAKEELRRAVPGLDVIDPRSLAGRAGVAAGDPTHLLIETHSVGLTGFQADDWLRDERHIDVELSDHRRIIPLFTFAHGEAEVRRLVEAIADMIEKHPDAGGDADVAPLPSRAALRTDQKMLPREAFFSETEPVKPRQARGRISAELVTPYPPGIPVLAPGETITEPIVDYLQEIVAAGAFLEGASDQALDSFRVVAE